MGGYLYRLFSGISFLLVIQWLSELCGRVAHQIMFNSRLIYICCSPAKSLLPLDEIVPAHIPLGFIDLVKPCQVSQKTQISHPALVIRGCHCQSRYSAGTAHPLVERDGVPVTRNCPNSRCWL